MVAMTLSLCGVAAAFPPKGEKKEKPTAEARFKKLDTNGDNFLSLEEFAGKKDKDKAAKAFAKKDKDGDKKLSLAEFAPPPKKKKKGE